MANTLAQNITVVSYSGATSANATYGSALTNPSLLVAGATDEIGIGTMTMADSTNGSYGTADAFVNAGGGTGQGAAGIFSKLNTSTATPTTTVTLSAPSVGFLKIYEFTGAATSSALDASNTSTGNLGTQSLGITTNTDHCSVIEIGTHYPSGAVADSGYTASFSETGGSIAYHFGEHRVDAGSASAITLTLGFTGTQQWAMAAAAYKTNVSAAVKRNNLMLSGVGR